MARLTRDEIWGTAQYMAPEQEMGSVSPEVDLYALAVCLYEMLTGELPFLGPNFLAQKYAERYKPPSQLVPSLPPGIDEIFKKALSLQPRNRFRSSMELVKALKALKAG